MNFKLLHVQVGYDRGHWWTRGHPMFLFIDAAGKMVIGGHVTSEA